LRSDVGIERPAGFRAWCASGASGASANASASTRTIPVRSAPQRARCANASHWGSSACAGTALWRD